MAGTGPVTETPLALPLRNPTAGQIELRTFSEADVPMLLDLSTDPYVPLTGTLPAHTDPAGAMAYIDRQHSRLTSGAGYSFCIALLATGQAVGQIGLWLAQLSQGRATAGYGIAPHARGHGLGGQALTALTEFAWTVPGLHRIELYVEPWNIASCRVAETAGYTYEGLLLNHQEIGGERVDMRLYASIRSTE